MGRKELVDELFEKANGDRHVFEESLHEAGIPFVDADSEESQPSLLSMSRTICMARVQVC